MCISVQKNGSVFLSVVIQILIRLGTKNDQQLKNPKHKYAMQPIFLKIANSENFADYLDYIDNLVAEYEADNKQNINFMDGISTEIESRSFETSTPKKKTEFLRNECEDCSNKSECVECIVRHGGVSTASCTPSSGCSEVESSTCSTSR